MIGVKEQQGTTWQQSEQERHQRYEYEQSWMDEVTDQTERLAAHMENNFTYQRDLEGRLYAEFDGKPTYLETVFQEGLEEGEHMARQDPLNWGFEAERRRIERDELREIQNLQGGEKMIVFSPLPDAVREKKTNIGGYNRERKKMLVRLAERRGDETEIMSFSLDGSHYGAMQAAAATIGGENAIPEDMSSEEILAQRFYAPPNGDFTLEDCHGLIRSAYDLEMQRQFGGTFYAGRKDGMSEQDALSFIKAQPDLISQHMEAVQDVMAKALDKNRQNKLLEDARYNFAAALEQRRKGKTFESLSDAGDMDRSAGVDHSGDCATGSSAGEQAGLSGYAQGRNGEMKCVGCPFCGKTVDAEVGADKSIACPECKTMVDKTGKVSKAAKAQSGPSFLDVIEEVEEEKKLKKLREAKKEEQRQHRRAAAKKVGKTAIKT